MIVPINELQTLPPGSIISISTHEIPEGFLECNGAELSKKKYSDLYRTISDIVVDAETEGYFKLLDYTDCFLRMIGEHSSQLGEIQYDAIRNIEGEIPGMTVQSTGVFARGRTSERLRDHNNDRPSYFYKFDASTVVPTADENRPINRAVKFIIKY